MNEGQTHILVVESESAGMRTDAYVADRLSSSRASVQQWIAAGYVQVENQPVNKNFRLRAGDTLSVVVPVPVEYEVQAEEIPLDVVYEDRYLLVVNKPKGMVVHPAAGHYEGTLVNALLSHCAGELSGINGVMRPGIVHRIDKDTSGLLIVAKTDEAHRGLAEQIKEHSFTRVYEAVIIGKLKEGSGTIDAPIGRHPTQRKMMAVTPRNSKPARTHYEVLEEMPDYSHIRLRLETGRTHQIRVHMAYLGHPVAGDTVYGPAKPSRECAGLHGQCLHAKTIGFIHPITGEYLEFSSELPDYFTDFIRKIR